MENIIKIQKIHPPGKSKERPDPARLKEDILGVQKTQDLYEKILEAAPDGMVFVEKSGRIILLNAQMENLFGYSREELVGKDLHLLIPDRFRKQHRENIDRFFANPGLRPMGSGLKIYGLKKDGTDKISKRGTGLGLSIAKKIMEDHGGFITGESKVGAGSAFSLYFPYPPPEASPSGS